MSQKDIILREGDATAKDIVLRALDPPTVVTTDIYLFAGDPAPNDIVLRSPISTPPAVSNSIAGAVTLTLAPAATMLEGRVKEGQVTLGLVASATMLEGRQLSGSTTLILSPAATMVGPAPAVSPDEHGKFVHRLNQPALRSLTRSTTQALAA